MDKISLQDKQKVFNSFLDNNNKSLQLILGYRINHLSKSFQKFVYQVYLNNVKYSYFKLGILLSMHEELLNSKLSIIERCLKDSNINVRHGASFIYTMTVGKNNFDNLQNPEQFKKFLESRKVSKKYFKSLFYGTSLGYISLLYKEFKRPATWQISNLDQYTIKSFYNHYKEQPLSCNSTKHEGVKSLEEALSCLNYSIELNSTRSESYIERYFIKSFIANKKQGKEKERLIKDAINDIEKAYTLNPESELCLKYLVYAYLDINHPKAKETFQKAFFNNPFDQDLREWKNKYKKILSY